MQDEGEALKLFELLGPVWWIRHISKCMLVTFCPTQLRDSEVGPFFLKRVHVEYLAVVDQTAVDYSIR